LRLDLEDFVDKVERSTEGKIEDPHHDGAFSFPFCVDGLKSINAQTKAMGQRAPKVSKLIQAATLIAVACGCFRRVAILPGSEPIATMSETKTVVMIPKTTNDM
jgi:hypothetical protein